MISENWCDVAKSVLLGCVFALAAVVSAGCGDNTSPERLSGTKVPASRAEAPEGTSSGEARKSVAFSDREFGPRAGSQVRTERQFSGADEPETSPTVDQERSSIPTRTIPQAAGSGGGLGGARISIQGDAAE